MLSKVLTKEIEKGMPAPLYFLWSEEKCFIDDALSKIIDTVLPVGAADFNYDQFEPSAESNTILDAVSTLPFMSPRRLVVLKDFHKFSAPAVKALAAYFKDPADTACMVILSAKAPKASIKAEWRSFALNIRQGDVPGWLKQTALKKGIKLTGDAVDSLIECVGYDIGMLLMEMEKLRLSGDGTISGRDVLSSVSMMRKYTPFDLIDSLIAGEKTRAFRILKTMLSGNAMEAPVIIGTLNWHYRQFYSLWQNRGRRPVKMREKTYRILSKYCNSFREQDFLHIFRSLHEADLGVKTSGRPELAIEVLLIKLLQKGTVC